MPNEKISIDKSKSGVTHFMPISHFLPPENIKNVMVF